jgi:hypothetical protein
MSEPVDISPSCNALVLKTEDSLYHLHSSSDRAPGRPSTWRSTTASPGHARTHRHIRQGGDQSFPTLHSTPHSDTSPLNSQKQEPCRKEHFDGVRPHVPHSCTEESINARPTAIDGVGAVHACQCQSWSTWARGEDGSCHAMPSAPSSSPVRSIAVAAVKPRRPA